MLIGVSPLATTVSVGFQELRVNDTILKAKHFLFFLNVSFRMKKKLLKNCPNTNIPLVH